MAVPWTAVKRCRSSICSALLLVSGCGDAPVDWSAVRQAACSGERAAVLAHLEDPGPLSAADAILRGRYRALALDGAAAGDALRDTQALEAAHPDPLPLERALDYGELAFFRTFGAPVQRLHATALDALGRASGAPGGPAPDALGIPGCPSKRTLAQARGLVRLRVGTAAFHNNEWSTAAAHLEAGLLALRAAHPGGDRFGDLSYTALLHNNFSELEWAAGNLDTAHARRLEALRVALEVGAEQTAGLAAAGLALIGADLDVPAPELADHLLATHLAERFLTVAGARRPFPWLAGMRAKLMAVRAVLLARMFGPLATDEVERLLVEARGLVALADTDWPTIGVAMHAGVAWAALGDGRGARGAWVAMLDAMAALWTSFTDARFQRGLLDHYAGFVRRVLAEAVATDDADLALHAMERSKDIALLRRFAWGPASRLDPGSWRLPAPPTLPDLQAALGVDDTLLHYDRIDGHVVVLRVTTEMAALHTASDLGLDGLLARHRRALAGDGAVEGTSRRLHARLIAPLGDLSRRLLIVPRGALHSLAWSTLRGDAGYLVEDHSVLLAPSATQVMAIRARAAVRATSAPLVLVVGSAHFDPVAVAAAAGRPGAPALVDEPALVAGTEAKVLHVKAHGRYLASDPAASYLELPPRGASDGRVTLAELAGAPLRVGTVVLQACEAARSEPAPGDQVDSFARAFLAAGASNVVAPLWTLPEATTRMVTPALHRQLRGGADAAEALRAVQLSMLRGAHGEAARDPRVWGIYVATGAPRG